MSKSKVLILPAATEDIKEIVHYYNSKQKGLGKKFTLRIRQATKILASDTNFVLREHGYNTMPIPPFPYLLHYKHIAEPECIAIFAVISTHQNMDKYPMDE